MCAHHEILWSLLTQGGGGTQGHGCYPGAASVVGGLVVLEGWCRVGGVGGEAIHVMTIHVSC